MTTVAQIAKKIQGLLTTTADELGRETGFIERQRAFSGATFVQTLVFGWMSNPTGSLSELRQVAQTIDVQVSRQGIAQRFTAKAVPFMQAMVQAALAESIEGPPVQAEVWQAFNGVYLLDSTRLSLPESLADVWPGCGGHKDNACLKISVLWEMVSGSLCAVEFMKGNVHDRQAAAAQRMMPPGSLRLADLGYFKLSELHGIDQRGGYWVTPYKKGTRLWLDGQDLDLAAYLARQAEPFVDCQVLLGLQARLPVRLIAHRVSPDVLKQRQHALKEQMRKRQWQASATLRALLAWDIFVTNVPASQFTTQELLTVARYRWQIELLFKLWKSEGMIDEWRTTNPWRIQCEIYAKLLVLLFQHWIMLAALWVMPDRSLTQALRTTRHFAWQLAHDLLHSRRFLATLKRLIRCVATCRMGRSKVSPRTFQRLEALS